MKKISYLLLIIAICTSGILSGCAAEDETPPQPLFEGTELITSVGTGDPITWVMPDVKYQYVVVGIFSSAPTVTNGLINPSNWKAGTRTGLAGFTDGSVAKASIYTYSASTGDFTSTPFTTAGTYYIAIWAYDQDMNLVASSQQIPVAIGF